MDDVLLFANTMQEIKDMLHTAKRFLEGELLLTLKEETVGKTASGVPFLGFLLKPQGIYLSQKKKKRLKNRIKQYRYKHECGAWNEEEYACTLPLCLRTLQSAGVERIVIGFYN